ncbi:hypothetical protein OJF2_17300 [Aquisphaera giovannonii]|uniref:Uncharacterized protein n=1 Tax=Aquisphaera giovannonii TaxID=406548 RepID=A0A5B9VZY1_9BACT|nr:hypothetical protein [Aquisphaera giovannonii]QEH33230.1 hypothetical protein OJF2_17300 [Aquisphaera giovannonii]
MSDPAFINERFAAEIGSRTEMTPAAAALLREGLAPGAYLDLLASGGLHLDGIRFLARGMIKRAAVWWACRCVATADPEGSATGPAESALKAARDWVTDPSDERRRGCWAAAQEAGIDTPAGCTALAAFLSEGSLAPPELTAVPPREDLTARAATGAILLAAVIRQPEKAPEKHATFFAIGREVAEGKDTWPSPTRIPPPTRPTVKKR